MDTEFEILRRFETQLMRVAERDKRRAESPPPKRSRRPWRAAIAVAAALLSLSFVVGLLATGGSVLGRQERSSSASSAGGSAPNPGSSSAPGFGLPAEGGQALGVPRGAPGAAHLGVRPRTSKQRPRSTKVRRRAPAAVPRLSNRRAPPQADQADLSKIIRDGQIAVTIDDGTFKATAGSVAHIAAVNGGSILSSSTEGGDSGSFTLRIPAANFDKAMVQLAQLGTVDSSASQGQDVTAQYVDLQGPHEDLSLPAPGALRADAAGDDDRPDADPAEPARRRAAEDRPAHRTDQLHQQAGRGVDDQGRPARSGRGGRGEPRRDRQPEPRARMGPGGARVPERARGRRDRARVPDPAARRHRARLRDLARRPRGASSPTPTPAKREARSRRAATRARATARR